MAVRTLTSVKDNWKRSNINLLSDYCYPGKSDVTTEEFLEWKRKLLYVVNQIIENELSEKQQKALNLYFFENLKLEEIASLMMVSKSEVSRLIKRSKQKIYKLTMYSGILKEKV